MTAARAPHRARTRVLCPQKAKPGTRSIGFLLFAFSKFKPPVAIQIALEEQQFPRIASEIGGSYRFSRSLQPATRNPQPLVPSHSCGRRTDLFLFAPSETAGPLPPAPTRLARRKSSPPLLCWNSAPAPAPAPPRCTRSSGPRCVFRRRLDPGTRVISHQTKYSKHSRTPHHPSHTQHARHKSQEVERTRHLAPGPRHDTDQPAGACFPLSLSLARLWLLDLGYYRLASLPSAGKRCDLGISVFVESQFPSFLAPVASVRASWPLRLHRPSSLVPRHGSVFPQRALSWPRRCRSTHPQRNARAHTGSWPRSSSSSPKPCHHLNLLFSSLLQVISCRSFPRNHSSTPLNPFLQLSSLFAPSRRFDRSLPITHHGPPNSCNRALDTDVLSTSPDTSAFE